MKGRECLECGFITTTGEDVCAKCDAVLSAQTDGSTATVDIAHHGETVDQALEKLGEAVRLHLEGYTQFLRVITGRGAIRAAAGTHLAFLHHSGRILHHEEEPGNPGAMLITLRR